jgi:repressor LexA
MAPLTERQAQVLLWIREFISRAGFPPTRAEISKALGFRSPNAAEEHLRALARKGAIELLRGASRGIRILERADELPPPPGIPVVGRVAAGNPLLAAEHIEDHYRLDPELFRPRADYLLRVVGESMREAGILDGDLLAVHRTPEAHNGQIVVARVGEEVTVKRFQRRGQAVRLLPENPDFQPILVDLRQTPLVIEGIGVGVLRNGKPL